MHPPLDRPHPMCQTEIDNLRKCHSSHSKFNFWACNEIKYALDKCFKLEKQVLLKELNANFEAGRRREDDALQEAMGHTMTFEEYLSKDKGYLKEVEKAKGNQIY